MLGCEIRRKRNVSDRNFVSHGKIVFRFRNMFRCISDFRTAIPDVTGIPVFRAATANRTTAYMSIHEAILARNIVSTVEKHTPIWTLPFLLYFYLCPFSFSFPCFHARQAAHSKQPLHFLVWAANCPLLFVVLTSHAPIRFTLTCIDRLFSKNGRMPGGAGRRTSTSFEAINASSATGIPNLVR